jgi:hypothetical protein
MVISDGSFSNIPVTLSIRQFPARCSNAVATTPTAAPAAGSGTDTNNGRRGSAPGRAGAEGGSTGTMQEGAGTGAGQVSYVRQFRWLG